MSRYLISRLQTLEPYTPGEQLNDRSYVKLNTNESPFPPAPGVAAALADTASLRLERYPDPGQRALRAELARAYGLTPDMVCCANGSDDLLGWSFLLYGSGGKMYCPDITYSFYRVFAQLFSVELCEIPLEEDFSICPERYFGLGAPIVIANPNAPTGLALSRADIRRILDANPAVPVIIDEAYVDFGGESAVPLLAEYPNLIVIGTFSKSRSLAGLRCGFVFANPEVISDYDRVRCSFNPYNLSSQTMAAAIAAVRDAPYYARCIREIIRVRALAAQRFRDLGCVCTDSKANFLFVSHPHFPACDLYRALKADGVLVRYFPAPRIDRYLRVSIGTAEQMERLFDSFINITKETNL